MRVIRSLLADELSDTLLPGKATKLQLHTTVPQTDTGAQMSILRRLRELRRRNSAN